APVCSTYVFCSPPKFSFCRSLMDPTTPFEIRLKCPLDSCPSVKSGGVCPFGNSQLRSIPSSICTNYLLGGQYSWWCSNITGWPGLIRCDAGFHPTEEQLHGPPEVLEQVE